MKLAHFSADGRTRLGLVSGRSVYDLQDSVVFRHQVKRSCRTIDELLAAGGLDALRKLRDGDLKSGKAIPLSRAKFESPVLSPEKILLAAVNYRAHGKEQSAKPPTEPYFFTKFRNALMGDRDPILIPRGSTKVDWEVELAAVIGKRCKYVSRSKAMEYVAGFAVSNDISFRDLQFPEGWPKRLNPLGQNWVMGKGLDNAFPLGPWLVTSDEMGDLDDLDLTLKVNGVVRQHASTSDMIFGVDEMITYLSQGTTLMPGDVISTGTPMGVAAFTGGPFLKSGDLVEASVEGIGTLHNPVKSDV